MNFSMTPSMDLVSARLPSNAETISENSPCPASSPFMIFAQGGNAWKTVLPEPVTPGSREVERENVVSASRALEAQDAVGALKGIM
jgi:hypothetical protein